MGDDSGKKIAERFVRFSESNDAGDLFAEDVFCDINVPELEVRGGKVTEWTMYCTGEWSPETRERQAREATMFRP